MYTIYTELWQCDLLKATTDDAPDGDRIGDPSAQSPMPQSTPVRDPGSRPALAGCFLFTGLLFLLPLYMQSCELAWSRFEV